MKKNLLLLLMLLSFLLAASCSKDEVETPTLTLSESEVHFSKIAAEKSISITTNQKDWKAMENVDWISIAEADNNLVVKVSTNTMASSRKGKVAVFAGGISVTLNVEQSASEATIVALPDKMEVSRYEGTYKFYVDTNTDNWSVATDADWLTIQANPHRGEIGVTVAENKEKEKRQAILTLTAGEATQTFTVVQDGILYYILPYTEFHLPQRETMRFELNRGSLLVKHAEYWPYIRFRTASPIFPVTEYGIFNDLTYDVIMWGPDEKVLFDKDFLKLMDEERFTYLGTGGDYAFGGREYESERENFLLWAILRSSGLKDAAVVFKAIEKQPQPYPTFEKFPYGFIDFKADTADVIRWERQNRGTLKSASGNVYTKQYTIEFNVENGPALTRVYTFGYINNKITNLLEITQYYPPKKHHLFAYPCSKSLYGDISCTQEFKALMQAEGFNRFGWVDFEHPEKKIKVFVQVANVNMTSGRAYILIRPIEQQPSESAVLPESITKRESILKQRIDDMRKTMTP